MAVPFINPTYPLLVFTDLDGTLLDHDTYSFAAAVPALSRLRELNVPVIPTTSKTLAELEVLNAALGNPHPCIVENGSALCIPRGYFGAQAGSGQVGEHEVIRLAPAYADLLETLHGLREQQGLKFRGFHDMDAGTVARDTGLSLADAERARQRLCSEPLVWEDSEVAFARFTDLLVERGLSLTRGGRYWHVMAGQSKARALDEMCRRYAEVTDVPLATVALGDSPNDEGMLQAADIAVIVRRPDGSHLDPEGMQRVLVTRAIGPTGWNESMQTLLNEFSQVHGDSRTSQGGSL